MIKGMDVMESEAAKYKFEREKNKYSCSEHLERFRQIQISRGMDPTHAEVEVESSSIDLFGIDSSQSQRSDDPLSPPRRRKKRHSEDSRHAARGGRR